MILRWPSQNTFGIWILLYWRRCSRTQFGVSINVWRLTGDNLGITGNFLYCNHQVHREVLITLYLCDVWKLIYVTRMAPRIFLGDCYMFRMFVHPCLSTYFLSRTVSLYWHFIQVWYYSRYDSKWHQTVIYGCTDSDSVSLYSVLGTFPFFSRNTWPDFFHRRHPVVFCDVVKWRMQ
jgi:hypothetical protein